MAWETKLYIPINTQYYRTVPDFAYRLYNSKSFPLACYLYSEGGALLYSFSVDAYAYLEISVPPANYGFSANIELGLVLQSEARNRAPLFPGAFTQPIGTLETGDVKVVSWGHSGDEDGNFLRTIADVQINGGAWTTVESNLKVASFNYTIPANATTLKFRVRGEDTLGLFSGYRESVLFTVTKPMYYWSKFNTGFHDVGGGPQYWKGTLITSDIKAVFDAYLNDVRNPDGFWYVRGSRVSQSIAPPTAFTVPATGSILTPNQMLNITFGASTAPNMNLYEVQQRYNAGTWVNVGIHTSYLTRTFTVTTDSALKAVEFRVRAKDLSNIYSDYVYSEIFTIQHNVIPTVPETLSVTGSFKPGGVVNLISGVSTDADGDTVQYQMQYSYDNSAWVTISTATTTTRSFTIPIGTASQFIYFRVRAFDGKEYTEFRKSAEYTIAYNTAPSTPTSLYVTGNPTFLTKGLTYTVNFPGATDVDLDSLTHYVSYSPDGARTWKDIGNTADNNIQWTVPTDLVGTIILFRVRVFDGSLYSGYRSSPTYTVNNKTEITLTSLEESVEINEADKILLAGTAKDADANQVVMVYYEVGDSGEMIIASSVSGAEFLYSKELTFKGNAIWDGEVKVAENVVANGVLGSVVIKVYAKDTVGAVSDIISKTLTMRPNQKPTITIDKNSFSLGEGSVREVIATAKDVDVNDLKVVVNLRGHAKEYEVALGKSDGVAELVHAFKVNAYGSNIYFGEDRTRPLNVGKLSSGTHYLEVVAKDEHGAVSDTKTVTITLVANRKPIVTMNTAPKIIVVSAGSFIFTGNVSDLDTYDKPALTFGVRENGAEILNIPIGSDGSFTYNYTFDDADVGFKTMVFIANDKKEITSITQEFEIVDEKILFEFKTPVETDLDSHKVNVILGYLKSANAVLKVEMCNNGFDASPTWENITQNISDNSPYSFTNKVKTAAKWGINIRVELVKNLAPTIYIDRIGILFE